MCLQNQWVQIHSFKHNGALHRCWDKAYVLEINDSYIITASQRTKVIESDGRRWFTNEPAITIFSKNDWFNVICMFKENGICYYCNIASPSIIDDYKIKYIDYDLDLKLYPDNTIRVLDEHEYEKHRQLYGYDGDLDKVLKIILKKIYHMMKNREYPFVDEKINDYYQCFLKQKEHII